MLVTAIAAIAAAAVLAVGIIAAIIGAKVRSPRVARLADSVGTMATATSGMLLAVTLAAVLVTSTAL
jgi:hypothetical protein